MKLIERVSDLRKFYAIEEVNYEAEVEKILIGFNCSRRFCKTNFRVFGGGECEWLALKLLQKSTLTFYKHPN
jgi:ATP-binding cassette subfamily F protein 3